MHHHIPLSLPSFLWLPRSKFSDFYHNKFMYVFHEYLKFNQVIEGSQRISFLYFYNAVLRSWKREKRQRWKSKRKYFGTWVWHKFSSLWISGTWWIIWGHCSNFIKRFQYVREGLTNKTIKHSVKHFNTYYV